MPSNPISYTHSYYVYNNFSIFSIRNETKRIETTWKWTLGGRKIQRLAACFQRTAYRTYMCLWHRNESHYSLIISYCSHDAARYCTRCTRLLFWLMMCFWTVEIGQISILNHSKFEHSLFGYIVCRLSIDMQCEKFHYENHFKRILFTIDQKEEVF